MSLPDYDPATFQGAPGMFRVGDRVVVAEDRPLGGFTGEVVGFKVHPCPDHKNDFLMPVVKLDHRSWDGEKETFYPFSLKPLDPVTALARLARPA